MKTKMSFLMLLLSLATLQSQIAIDTKKESGNVSKAAYNKRISQNFNYLLFGENSPQQGISATLNDTKSNIKINGLLYSGKRGVLSMEADLSASNGVYFFDRENGSEQGKITFNYFRPIWKNVEYYKLDKFTQASTKLEILEMLTQSKNEYKALKTLVIEIVGRDILEDDTKDEALDKLKKFTVEYINNQEDLDVFNNLEERDLDMSAYYFKTATASEKNQTSKEQVIRFDTTGESIIVEYNDNKNINKILSDYKAKKKYIINELEAKINDVELENAESKWAGDHILFLGISPFYERQSFKRFLYDNTTSFVDMFTTERGNIYGVTLTLNYTLGKGSGSKNIYKPEFLFFRLATTLNRASNLSNFKASTLDITTPLGDDVNGNPITFTNADNAFIGDATYEYGTGAAFTFEGYYYPFQVPIGMFASIGYQIIKFNSSSDIKDKELYPLRLGLLFSLTNKDEGKPLVTIQTFIDRTNLSLSPNGKDNDLRFGLGIGLPIYLK